MQYKKELEDIDRECRTLLKKINEEDMLRDSHWVRTKQRNLEKEFGECKKRRNILVKKINQCQEYHDILKNKIIFMITNDLTIGRTDNDLIPYGSDEIDNFIKENNDKIEHVIENIINDYDKDGEIELLKDPLMDWIGEYLYQHVITMPFLDNM